MLIISLFWQCSISAHLFHLASLHRPGVPHRSILMIQQTETFSDTQATVIKVTKSAASLRGGESVCVCGGGGGAGEMFNNDSQRGQTDGQIDCLCSDR